jgi:hypothetical protein
LIRQFLSCRNLKKPRALFISEIQQLVASGTPDIQYIRTLRQMQTPISKRWYRSRIVIIFFHILAWLALFLLPVLFHRDPDQSSINWKVVFNIRSFVFDGCCILFFYLNSLLLIPKFLNREKIGIYITAIVLLFGVVLTILNFYGKVQMRIKDEHGSLQKVEIHKEGFQR